MTADALTSRLRRADLAGNRARVGASDKPATLLIREDRHGSIQFRPALSPGDTLDARAAQQVPTAADDRHRQAGSKVAAGREPEGQTLRPTWPESSMG
jgi:hypothetical protein